MRLVLFERWMDPIAETRLADRPEIEVARLRYAEPADANGATMSGAHGYQIAPRGELKQPWFGDADLLARCPNLLAISSTGAGYDMVDVGACTRAGVIVCNQSGSNVEAVAEHALGMMLALSKQIVQSDKALRGRAGLDRFAYTGGDLYGKTVGLIGIGQIGTRTAQLCGTLLGMPVLAYDPYLTSDEIAARGATKVDLDTLLRRSDFVSVHCPRTAETLGMIAGPQFAAMKRSAYFVTTARGGIHDEPDLARAIERGDIAGAGLDVFLEEPPPPDHPLLHFDNVVASPHIAGVTAEARRMMAESAAEQWIAIAAGEVPPRLVNPAAWPRYAERFLALFGFDPAPLPEPTVAAR